MSAIDDLLEQLNLRSKERFETAKAIMSYDEFLAAVVEQPYMTTRNTAQFLRDMMDHFGCEESGGLGQRRFRVFDDMKGGEYRVLGQEATQNEIYRSLNEFVQRRQNDRMILLHGPNGSSKTSLVRCMMHGAEIYSQMEEGTLLTFNWIFSEADEKGESLGFRSSRIETNFETFAFLEAERISARIPSELRDHPIFLIPVGERAQFLETALAACSEEERRRFVPTRFLMEGELSPKSMAIYQALLAAYRGDWRQVVKHVQVQRFRISQRYRQGAVTIEPQANVDASSRQIGHSSMTGLPNILLNTNLYEATGDLIDGNRGIVEYSDFFKRPIEANKYLLTMAESGCINLPSYTAFLELFLIGTSNENYLSAFRRDPLFPSFNARMDLIRVPYLLEASKEEEIYHRLLAKLPNQVRIAPHTTKIAAMWAVMTRLMQSSGSGLSTAIEEVAQALTPLEKLKLYDRQEVPQHLDPESKSKLREELPILAAEYDGFEAEFEGLWDAAYEGRRGCSPRELMTFLSEIAGNPPGGVVTPMLILRSLPAFIADKSLFQFLRLAPTQSGYHDCKLFIDLAKQELVQLIMEDVQVAADLVEANEYSRVFARYFKHLRALETEEKIYDEGRDEGQDPDRAFMTKVEELLGGADDPKAFRSSLMTQVAAFRIGNPDGEFDLEVVFADLLEVLRTAVFQERIEAVADLVANALVLEGVVPGKLDEEAKQRAMSLTKNMQEQRGYCAYSMREAFEVLLADLDEKSTS